MATFPAKEGGTHLCSARQGRSNELKSAIYYYFLYIAPLSPRWPTTIAQFKLQILAALTGRWR